MRQGPSVQSVPVFIHPEAMAPREIKGCNVTLRHGESVVETSSSLIGIVKRGDTVVCIKKTQVISRFILSYYS